MKFQCTGFRAVEAETMNEAATIFAERAARREYGKTGYHRTLRADSWSEDGTTGTYEAFIGYTPRGQIGTTSGHNIWLTVTR